MVRFERNTGTGTQTNAHNMQGGPTTSRTATVDKHSHGKKTVVALKRTAEEGWNDPWNNEANWTGTIYHRRQPSYILGRGKQKMSRRIQAHQVKLRARRGRETSDQPTEGEGDERR